jgi:hypothetical protein
MTGSGEDPPRGTGGHARDRLREQRARELGEDPASPSAVDEGESSASRTRPPGGKALLRKLQLLAGAGYEQAAAEALGLALDDDQVEEVRAGFGVVVPLPAPAKGRTAKGRTAKKASAKPSTVGQVADAMQEAAALLSQADPSQPQWRSLGPTTVPNGQTYGSSRVNISGRVSTIAIDPSSANHVLVGAANGGVWETFDQGASWSPRTDYQATLAVGAIAFDPDDSSVVYCGLGEGNWWSWLGTGVLRSGDGGTTWSPLCTAPFVGQGFYDLVVDPHDRRRLFAATTGGLYVSTDKGHSWVQRRAATTWSISIGSGAAGHVLAACTDGVWRSNNHGTSFTAVSIPGSPGSFSRLAVAIAPSDPTVAYAWGAGSPNTSSGPTPYLWRRSGNTWAAQTAPPGVATGQSWYDWFLAVSPDKPDQIYCGAISAYRGTRSGSAWSWVDIATKATGDSIHPDQHAIAIERGNPDVIYVGCDGGLFQSPDRGQTWTHKNNGLVITEFEYIAQNLGSSRWLMGGTQDNGTERWQGSPTWEHIADGDGGDCAVNRGNPDIVFHTFYGMSPQRSTSRGDWGSWTNITPPVPSGEGSPFYPPFETSASSGDTTAMAGAALYLSRDNGSTWTRVGFAGGGSATAMYIPDPNTVLVGLDTGQVQRTTWSGSSWSALSAMSTPRAGASVSDIAVDPNNASRIWVTYATVGGGRVFLSTDAGSTFTDRTSGLPNLSVTSIALDPWNSNRAWVSASLGVYQTTDGGSSWTGFASSLPNAYVGDLAFHQHARVLRAGLRNRGAWEVPVDGWMTTPICGTQWTGTLAANQTQRWFTFNWPAVWHVIWTVMPTTVTTGSPSVAWDTQVERASAEFVTYWISVTNLTSAPVTFEGRYCVLSRY